MEKRENGKWRKPRKYKLLQKLLDANEYVAPIKQANPYTTNKPPEDVLVTIQTAPGDVFDLKLELEKAKARKGKNKITQVPVKENLMHGKGSSGMVMSNMSGTDTAHKLQFPPQTIDLNKHHNRHTRGKRFKLETNSWWLAQSPAQMYTE